MGLSFRITHFSERTRLEWHFPVKQIGLNYCIHLTTGDSDLVKIYLIANQNDTRRLSMSKARLQDTVESTGRLGISHSRLQFHLTARLLLHSIPNISLPLPPLSLAWNIPLMMFPRNYLLGSLPLGTRKKKKTLKRYRSQGEFSNQPSLLDDEDRYIASQGKTSQYDTYPRFDIILEDDG